MPEFNRNRSQAQRPGRMRPQGDRGPGGGRGGGNVSGGGGDGASPRPAVPWYVGTKFQEAPPGHRYLLYLPFWRNDWSAIKEGKQRELKKLGAIRGHASEMMSALAERQRAIGKANGGEVIEAINSSPFATGLGWEHPNENGFAFLHPYGLPYLAGSGVKGVLRRAAQELAEGLGEGTHGWTNDAVVALFGLEPEPGSDKASQGALRFLDVIPEVAGEGMGVDIMNPHYGEYYQGESTPHDAGNPVPIFFLVVPPGSKFTFIVDCPREHRLPEELRGKWRSMIRAAFTHAFDWLGFGAKTAVGYGAMAQLSDEEVAAARVAVEQAERKCIWVEQTITRLVKERKANNEKEALRSRVLAEAWKVLSDTSLKEKALADIKARWQAEGWWDKPLGKSAKQAKAIYEGSE